MLAQCSEIINTEHYNYAHLLWDEALTDTDGGLVGWKPATICLTKATNWSKDRSNTDDTDRTELRVGKSGARVADKLSELALD